MADNPQARYKPDTAENRPYLFISYSSKDSNTVQRIIQLLRINGYYYWYDEGNKPGRDWSDSLADRIIGCAQFLLVLTENSAKSENVLDELYLAKKYNKPLLVVYIDDIKVSGGLDLKIGRIHSLMRNKYGSENEFNEELVQALSISTKKPYKISTPKLIFDLRLEERYEIIEKIGEGATGSVFRGKDRKTGSMVAIKICGISPTYSGNLLLRLYNNERDALNRLATCPYVPKLVDWYMGKRAVCLILNYIKGYPLESFQFNEVTILELFNKILGIFNYLEDCGIIHKDIKPNNLLIDELGTVYLLDFGGSYICDETNPPQVIRMASPGFAAPEQYGEMDIIPTFATDCYGLGRTLQYLLINRYVYAHDFRNFSGSVHQVRKDISDTLAQVLTKMTRQDPKERYQNVNELRGDLYKCDKSLFATRIPSFRDIIAEQKSLQECDVPYDGEVDTNVNVKTDFI